MQELKEAVRKAKQAANRMKEETEESPVHAADAACYLAAALRDIHCTTMAGMNTVLSRTTDMDSTEQLVTMVDTLSMDASLCMGGAIRLLVLLNGASATQRAEHHDNLIAHLDRAEATLVSTETLMLGWCNSPTGVQ